MILKLFINNIPIILIKKLKAMFVNLPDDYYKEL
jgi:hypothetical protein